MKTLNELIESYRLAQEYANDIHSKIINTEDGFMYMTQLRCYGSIQWESHKNEFCVQELCDEFYGDNGIVDVYTNNPNHNISSYGEVKVMTYDEIINMSKDNISMSKAICNWLTAGL